ncbi:MAG: hypothetical protein IPO09_19010 [Anaeromyxobacter sp.]|nr:hypothetical protein [Anaeromyxobacter sp.]MBL0276012.1 hypothetical protein [Anaeromyxobacter sp.]
MSHVKQLWSFIKSNPGKLAVVAVVSVVFLGGTILKFYNMARAKVPQLPAPKV